MKVWDAVFYHARGYIVLTLDSGEVYLDGTVGHEISGEREAGTKRSGEVAPPPPLSSSHHSWDEDLPDDFLKFNVPAKVPVIQMADKTQSCPLCAGRKAFKTVPALREPCAFCGGLGTVLVCRKCGGLYREGYTCLICEGKGLSVCPDCCGLGEQLVGVMCKTCKGTGHLTKSRNPLK